MDLVSVLIENSDREAGSVKKSKGHRLKKIQRGGLGVAAALMELLQRTERHEDHTEIKEETCDLRLQSEKLENHGSNKGVLRP